MLGQGLAFCLSALLALASIGQDQTKQPTRLGSTPSESIRVWHREGCTYRVVGELPIVSRIRALLESSLRNEALTNAEFVRQTLSDPFGARMTESTAPAQYVWVLIEG